MGNEAVAVGDRDWIVRTALDVDAPEWAWKAALKAATPAELARILTQLEQTRHWAELDRRDIAGKLAHLREQWPGIETSC